MANEGYMLVAGEGHSSWDSFASLHLCALCSGLRAGVAGDFVALPTV